MAEYNPQDGNSDHVTIIRERGGSGGIIVAVLALALIAVAAFWLIGSSHEKSASDAGIAVAAEKVGNAADKVGGAAEDAAKNMNN